MGLYIGQQHVIRVSILCMSSSRLPASSRLSRGRLAASFRLPPRLPFLFVDRLAQLPTSESPPDHGLSDCAEIITVFPA